jgi:hypothetical protein
MKRNIYLFFLLLAAVKWKAAMAAWGLALAAPGARYFNNIGNLNIKVKYF